MAKDKNKDKKKHDTSEDKHKKKRKRDESQTVEGGQHAEEHTPRPHKKSKEGKTQRQPTASLVPTPDAVSTKKAKKRKSMAAAAAASDGRHEDPTVQQQPQQQQQHQGQQGSIAQRSAPMPAAPKFDPLRDGDNTLAAFRAVKPPAGADQLQPCWPLKGTAPAPKQPLAPMARVLEGKAELWVLQLPEQMEADALDGCVIKVDEGMAAHPERSGVVGQLEISREAAQDTELVRRYSITQEGAAAREPLFVAAPTERSGGYLEVLRPSRRLVVAEDVADANERLVERVHVELPPLQFYPGTMPPKQANVLLQKQHIFKSPPAQPQPGTWPPASWTPSALLERDRRRAARRKRGLPEVDPQDDLEQQQLTDLRPAPGAPWGISADGTPLPPQWCTLPGGGEGAWRAGAGKSVLGDVEQDVSVAYTYA